MPRDDELDRLKAAQDAAYAAKQSAWTDQDDAWKKCQDAREKMSQAYANRDAAYATMQTAWQARRTAREALDQAFAAKQSAYEYQQSAWDQLQRVRDYNGPRIDHLNGMQESAYQNMVGAFGSASDAHNDGDGAAARAYADEGHGHKADAQAYVQERRALVDEIRQARDSWESVRGPFQQAKADFDCARGIFQTAKEAHEQKQGEFQALKTHAEEWRVYFNAMKEAHGTLLERFKDAKSNLEKAKAAHNSRRSDIQAARQNDANEMRELARRAGVPSEYLDSVHVTVQSDGTVSILFGGAGSPDGPGHGHFVMDASGNVTYQRAPSDEHGAQNYIDHKEAVIFDRSLSTESPVGATGSYDLRGDNGGHSTQYYDDKTRVSWNTDSGGRVSFLHWTAQKLGKGSKGRHKPPPHAT